MCLERVTTESPLIAEEDIVVYKAMIKDKQHWIDGINDGDECIAVINKEKVKGKLSIKDEQIWICHNNVDWDGNSAPEKHGFKYSWVLDYAVDSIKVKGKEVEIQKEDEYETAYQSFPIKIGKSYSTSLRKLGSSVDKGFHSYVHKKDAIRVGCDVAKCIIPKGSEYYIGRFGDDASIASNQIKFVKII